MSLPDSTFRAKQGAAVLIAAGSVIPLDNQPLDIEIPITGANECLTLRLIFVSNPSEKTSRWAIKTFPENPKLIELTILNLKSPLGGGPSEPISLWRNTDSAILLALRIHTLDNVTPTIHFSFYSKKHEVKS